MSKALGREQFSRQRNELMDRLYSIPEKLCSSRVQALDLVRMKKKEGITQFVQAALLSEDTGIEVYESPDRIESISQISVHRAVQGVVQNFQEALSHQDWPMLSVLLGRPVKEALCAMQLLDALWEMLPENIDAPTLETWHEESDTVLCVRVNHAGGSFLCASSPLTDVSAQFAGVESPRHPGSWFSARGEDLMQDLLQG